jgi:glycosyltransferase involved in cell wall biosynthesis
MRIAFINNFYNAGGSSMASYELAKAFSKNHEMMFVGSVDGPFREKFGKFGQTLLWSSKNFDYGQDITEKLEAFNPDITHVFIPGSQNPQLFSRLPGKKKFATILCGQAVGFDPAQFNKIFFSSNYQAKLSPNVSNYKIVRYGISTDKKIKEQSEHPTFGRISTYCSSKMLHDTLLCASELRANNFAGEILDSQYVIGLQAYAAHLELKNLLMESNITDDRKNEILSSIDVYHYPSSNEAFCFSLLEAFSHGLPAISYKNSAIPEMFDTDEWLCDDFEQLIEKTKLMASKSKKERQEIGINNFAIYQSHSPEIYVKTILNSYSE